MQALSPRWAVLALLLVLTSCAVLTRDPPVPPPLSRAAPFEFRQIRFLPFEDGTTIRQSIQRSFLDETAESYTTGPGSERVYNYLAVSGGGSDGAFGAGLINGWTETGTRPSFKIGWVSPSPQPVQRALPNISMRAILSMLKVSGINDLWRLYIATRDDDVQFHYVAIPADYVPSTIEQFNQVEMNREFGFGRDMAVKGIPWRAAPPGYAAPQSDIAQE